MNVAPRLVALCICGDVKEHARFVSGSFVAEPLAESEFDAGALLAAFGIAESLFPSGEGFCQGVAGSANAVNKNAFGVACGSIACEVAGFDRLRYFFPVGVQGCESISARIGDGANADLEECQEQESFGSPTRFHG